MARLALVTLVVIAASGALAGCKKKENGASDSMVHVATTAPRDAAPPAQSIAATDRAKQILDAQVAASRTSDASLAGTFDAHAVVLVPDPRVASDPHTGLSAAILRLAPGSSATTVTVDDLVASGTTDAVWWSAELAVTVDGPETPHDVRVRVTELATAESGWKVVAAAFSESEPVTGRKRPAAVSSAPDPASLTAVIADPSKLAAALAPDATVFGTDSRARGTDAKKLVSSWTGFALRGAPTEVRGGTWAYVLGTATLPAGKYAAQLGMFAIGVPLPSGGWSVVALQLTTL